MVNSQMPVDGSQEHCLQDIFPMLVKQDFGVLITSPLRSMTYQLKFAQHQDICHRAGGIVPWPQGNTDAACCVGRGLTSWWHGDGGEEEWPTGEAIGRDPEITVVLWDNSAGYSSIMLAECRWNQNQYMARAGGNPSESLCAGQQDLTACYFCWMPPRMISLPKIEMINNCYNCLIFIITSKYIFLIEILIKFYINSKCEESFYQQKNHLGISAVLQLWRPGSSPFSETCIFWGYYSVWLTH